MASRTAAPRTRTTSSRTRATPRARSTLPTRTAPPTPDDSAERLCWAAGEHLVVGVDEVGRGAWAGPLTVGAVAMRAGAPASPNGVRDSKLLSPAQRQQLFGAIASWCEGWATGDATAAECDELGMSAALQLATRRALDRLSAELAAVPDKVLVDGKWNFVDWLPSQAIVKGDQRCVSIAAASIMAKVTRDSQMADWSERFAPYGFVKNKGYPAPVHRAALVEYGACALHRTSWSFMRNVPEASPLPLPPPRG